MPTRLYISAPPINDSVINDLYAWVKIKHEARDECWRRENPRCPVFPCFQVSTWKNGSVKDTRKWIYISQNRCSITVRCRSWLEHLRSTLSVDRSSSLCQDLREFAWSFPCLMKPCLIPLKVAFRFLWRYTFCTIMQISSSSLRSGERPARTYWSLCPSPSTSHFPSCPGSVSQPWCVLYQLADTMLALVIT